MLHPNSPGASQRLPLIADILDVPLQPPPTAAAPPPLPPRRFGRIREGSPPPRGLTFFEVGVLALCNEADEEKAKWQAAHSFELTDRVKSKRTGLGLVPYGMARRSASICSPSRLPGAPPRSASWAWVKGRSPCPRHTASSSLVSSSPHSNRSAVHLPLPPPLHPPPPNRTPFQSKGRWKQDCPTVA